MTAGSYSRATWTVLALAAAAVVVTLFFSWQIRSRAEQVADALAQAPLVTVAEIPAQGTARVEGRAQLTEPSLVAPLSGRQCAYYELELSGLKSGAGLRRKAQGRELLLTDASGTALVRLEGGAMLAPGSGAAVVVVAIDEAHCQQGTLAEIATDRRDAALRLLGVPAPAASEPGEIQYRECVLPAGARVAVGAAGSEPAPGYAGRTARGPTAESARVILAATPRQPLYIAVSAAE
jgi:hypothetical protein